MKTFLSFVSVLFVAISFTSCGVAPMGYGGNNNNRCYGGGIMRQQMMPAQHCPPQPRYGYHQQLPYGGGYQQGHPSQSHGGYPYGYGGYGAQQPYGNYGPRRPASTSPLYYDANGRLSQGGYNVR